METFNNSDNDIYSISEIENDTDTDTTDSEDNTVELIQQENGEYSKLYCAKELKKHLVVNTRGKYSSSDSLKIKLDEINFDCNMNQVIDTSFYSISDLNNKKFNDIYNILYVSQMIIFVDNYKLMDTEQTTFRKFLDCSKNPEIATCLLFLFKVFININFLR